MIREYPVKHATSAPSTGNMLYQYLIDHITIPASASHDIWYAGEEKKLQHPDKYAFRGINPQGEVLKNLIQGIEPEELVRNVFNPNHPIFVGNLPDKILQKLNIPSYADSKDKVFNPNFVPYDDLSEYTKTSNELAALSVAKSISSYHGAQGKSQYSEKDVADFFKTALSNLSSPQMMYLMHGNHLAWCTLAYSRDGNTEDLKKEFHAQNPTDFYTKDLSTILPGMFYSLALLGEDPVAACKLIDVDIWGANDVARYMQKFMHSESEKN